MIIRHFFISLFVYIFFMLKTVQSKTTSKDYSKFMSDCINKIELKKIKCTTVKISYMIWLMKYKSVNDAIFCLNENVISQSNTGKILKRQSWILLSALFNKKEMKKCGKLALKQALKTNKNVVNFPNQWNFLGPFQIGKPEVDGNPVREKAIDKRWSKNFVSYSELVPTGILKWTEILATNDGTIKLSPNINWNDLVMSLQSMAVTEWQGVLVNDFSVTTDQVNMEVQCLGVNIFYIDGKMFNGDVYHRQQFWYPLLLNIGIHTIVVPVRFAGTGVVKCMVRKASHVKNIMFHPDKIILPDFVDGNVFSTFVAIPLTNMDKIEGGQIKNVSVIPGNDLVGSISVDLLTLQDQVLPGQITHLQLKLNINVKSPSGKCERTTYNLRLKITTFFNRDKEEEEISLVFRCRSSTQSFLFTFVDHDGSVQQAAAIKPLKPCLLEICPVMLTLHGTGVSASNQADSYKQMKNNQFVFGVEKVWVLAPTRHGAHNWEGPGELTSLTALKNLAVLTKDSEPWMGKSADENVVIFAGHSMGGHGAWQLSVHNPDRALAIISAAGWLSKEHYGDSNLLYRHDISLSYIDPATKFIQESCIVENQADKHASNLKGIPVFIRVGREDKTVHPYFSRKMFRLLKEHRVDVRYEEIPGKEHWWWDSKEENDGGVSNDKQIRSFVAGVVDGFEESFECYSDGCAKKKQNKYSGSTDTSRSSGSFSYIVYNPASCSGGYGVRIIQQSHPLRKSTYHVRVVQNSIVLNTTNLQKLMLYEPKIEPVGWKKKKIIIDGCSVNINSTMADDMLFLCNIENHWRTCESEEASPVSSRTYRLYGPARRIAEEDFAVAVCNNGQTEATEILEQSAVILSNFFHLNSDARAPILKMSSLSGNVTVEKNLIILATDECLRNIPDVRRLIKVSEGVMGIGNCEFRGSNLSAMYLTTYKDKLALILTSVNARSIGDYLLKLTLPTIPPMTRSPFSNLLPEYVIVSPDVNEKGPGAYLCSGFWDNQWGYNAAMSSCVC